MAGFKDLKIKICFLILCLSIPSAIFAQEEAIPISQDSASAYLVTLGQRAQQKGRIQEAIREFSKALMLDPTNQQAQKRLQELGVSQDMLSARTTNPAELSNQIKVNQEQINQLIQEKIFLEQELTNLKVENNRLIEDKVKAETEAKALKQESQTPPGTVVNVLEDYLEVREKELTQVQEKLSAKEAELKNKNNLIDDQTKNLQTLEEDLKKAQARIVEENENVPAGK